MNLSATLTAFETKDYNKKSPFVSERASYIENYFS